MAKEFMGKNYQNDLTNKTRGKPIPWLPYAQWAAQRFGPTAKKMAFNEAKRMYATRKTPNLRGSYPTTPRAKSTTARRSTTGSRANLVSTKGTGPLARKPWVKKAKGYGKKQKKSNYLYDMLSPPVEENYREVGTQLDNSSSTQDVVIYEHLTAAKVIQFVNKAADIQNIAVRLPANLTQGNNNPTAGRLLYTGGWQKHTFMNSCSHTSYLTFYEFVAKDYCDNDPLFCWQNDLTRDGTTTNVIAPINVDQTVNTVKLEIKKDHIELFMKHKLLKKTKIILAPGETYIYFMRHPKFYFDEARYNISVDGSAPTYIKGVSKFLMAVCYGEMVTDSASTAVTTGSSHVAHNMEEMNYYRAPVPQKKVNRYASGSFGTVALTSTETTINEETDTQAPAYVELV